MTLDPNCHVAFPADKVRDAVKLAYDLSSPQGLGFLHARGGTLDDPTVDDILSRPSGSCVLHMDYVHGRSCKFGVFRIDGHDDSLFVRPRWYDHSDAALADLLSRLGVEDATAKIEAAQEAQRVENERWERENPR